MSRSIDSPWALPALAPPTASSRAARPMSGPSARTRVRRGSLLGAPGGCGLGRPLPAEHLGHVMSMSPDIRLVFDEFVTQFLLHVCAGRTEARDAVDHVTREMEAIEVVQDNHVERGGGGPLLLVAAHVKVRVVRPPVG